MNKSAVDLIVLPLESLRYKISLFRAFEGRMVLIMSLHTNHLRMWWHNVMSFIDCKSPWVSDVNGARLGSPSRLGRSGLGRVSLQRIAADQQMLGWGSRALFHRESHPLAEKTRAVAMETRFQA